MTREQAIIELNFLGRGLHKDFNSARAIKTAIRYLEAWDEIDDLVNKTYWAFPVGLDYCLDRLTEIMKEVEDE